MNAKLKKGLMTVLSIFSIVVIVAAVIRAKKNSDAGTGTIVSNVTDELKKVTQTA